MRSIKVPKGSLGRSKSPFSATNAPPTKLSPIITRTVAKATGAYTVAMTGNPESPLAKLADEVLIAAAPDGYLQPADLSARHCQLFVVDLLYLLIAQSDFDRTTRFLAASGAAVAPRRRPARGSRIVRSAPQLAVAELTQQASEV